MPNQDNDILTYLILKNVSTSPQTARVSYAIEGGPQDVRRTYVLAGCERKAIGIHDDPEFVGRQRNFSAIISFDLPAAAQLTMRSAREFWKPASMPPPIILK